MLYPQVHQDKDLRAPHLVSYLSLPQAGPKGHLCPCALSGAREVPLSITLGTDVGTYTPSVSPEDDQLHVITPFSRWAEQDCWEKPQS